MVNYTGSKFGDVDYFRSRLTRIPERYLPSAMGGDLAKVFTKILTFHVPPPATILDPCCGLKIMYQALIYPTLFGKNKSYNFVWGDLYPKDKNIVKLDFTRLPFKNGYFDAIVVDPPFIKRVKNPQSQLVREVYRSLIDWNTFFGWVRRWNHEFYRITKPQAKLIIKCQDHVDSERIIPIDWEISKTLTLWRLIDRIVYRYCIPTSKTPLRKHHSILLHQWFLIYKKPPI